MTDTDDARPAPPRAEVHAAAEAGVEGLLGSVVEQSPLAIMVIGRDHRILLWNPAAETMFGWSADEVLADEPVAPDPWAGVDSRWLERVFAGERVIDHRIPGVRRDDAELVVSLSAAPLRRPGEAIEAVVLVAADVSERDATARALRASEERQRALLAHSSEMLALVDREWTITELRSPTSLGALPEAPLSWRDARRLLQPVAEDAARVARTYRELVCRPGASERIVYRVEAHDGSLHWLDTVVTNLLDDPCVGALVVNGRDVTEQLEAAEAVRASEHRHRMLVSGASDIISLVDADGFMRESSRAAKRLLGYDVEALRGASVFDLVHPEEVADARRLFQQFRGRPGVVGPLELRVRRADGTWMDAEILANDLLEDESVRGIVLTTRDVSERRIAARRRERESEILERIARGGPLHVTLSVIARTLEEHAPGRRGALLFLGPDGQVLRLAAAPTLAGLLGPVLDGAQVGGVGVNVSRAILDRDPVICADVTSEPGWEAWAEVLGPTGLRGVRAEPLVAPDHDRVLGVFLVLSEAAAPPRPEDDSLVETLSRLAAIAIEQAELHSRLAYQSLHDSLTGLPNRVLFLDRLRHALERGQRTGVPAGVLFLDLDRFKVVNDSLGHAAGDRLLAAVARRLQDALPAGDTVARFGGDEFTVLCEDLPVGRATERAGEIAQRVIEAMAEPFVVDEMETFLTVSAGVAVSEGSRRLEDPEDLVRDADAAMYYAKEGGRGRAEAFDAGMRRRAVDRHTTANRLHRALQRDELTLYYQPVVGLRSGRAVGAEAILRWRRPEQGLVSPARFIDLLEDSALVEEIGAWALRQGLAEVGHWRRRSGREYTLGVNLAPRQLERRDLPDVVTAALEAADVPGSALTLELTERALTADTPAVLETMRRLVDLGVWLTIDDFGAGYSGLGYLKRFPVHAVKLDRAFVSGLGRDRADEAITSAVVELGHALGLRVIAEGVESATQLVVAARLGCDAAQGFFLAEPQPAEEVAELLAGDRPWAPPGIALLTMRPPAGPRRT